MKQRTHNDWKSLTFKQKVWQVWDYYKLPIFIGFVFLYMLGYTIYRHETVKDIVFYSALINVAPGDALTAQLSTGFQDTLDIDPKKEEVHLYTGLYLTDNTASEMYQYSYSSQMKILAAINAQQLDVVLMDKEAFDAFSQNDYLYPMDELAAAYPQYKDLITANMVDNLVILEHNALEVALDPSAEYHSVTETHPLALDLSKQGLFTQVQLSGTVYLGILRNAPHLDTCMKYIDYILQS